MTKEEREKRIQEVALQLVARTSANVGKMMQRNVVRDNPHRSFS